MHIQLTFDSHLVYLLILSVSVLQGIGDSGQGFANAVLFILFTRSVRTSFMSCIVCCRKQKDNSDDNPRRSQPGTQDHNTPLLQDTSESS